MSNGRGQGRTFTPSEIARYYSIRAPHVKQTGREWRGSCPIHHGKRFSFAVHRNTGLWTCHSECGRGGSIFDLEMAISRFDFRRAATEVDLLIRGSVEGARKGPRRIVATYDYTDARLTSRPAIPKQGGATRMAGNLCSATAPSVYKGAKWSAVAR
jgi:hypothetical protein